jgi:hypothetical protein
MTSSETDLERALRLAATDPAARPDFYKHLLASTVFVLSDGDGKTPGARTFKAGEEVAIANWVKDDDTPIIPFFTSLAALQRAIAAETNYLAMPARSLFEITEGATLVLNPHSDHSKEFLPPEIAALLSGGVNTPLNRRVVQEATQVLLGQPNVQPTVMIAALQSFFATRSNVKAAYVCLMHEPSRDEKPHYLLGILAEGDFESLSRETGSIASDTAPDICDIIQIKPGDTGPSAYFLSEVEPFYERQAAPGWSARVRSFLGKK